MDEKNRKEFTKSEKDDSDDDFANLILASYMAEDIDESSEKLSEELSEKPVVKLGSIDNQDFFIYSIKYLRDEKLIKIWEGQRGLSKERVKDIYKYQLGHIKKHGTTDYRGALMVAKLNGNLYLFDGQHRYRSMLMLLFRNDVKDIRCRIDVININTSADIKKEFETINLCVPVPLNYIKPNEIVELAIAQLRKKYINAFSNKKVNRPCMKIDDVKAGIIETDVVSVRNIKTAEELVTLMENLNEKYRKRGKDYWVSTSTTAQKVSTGNAYQKCVDTEGYMYLGVSPVHRKFWFDLLCEDMC